MSRHPTSRDSRSVTSSPGSESGATRSDKPDGPMIDQCGPDLAPANLSPRQAKEKGLLTSGTYGPHGSGSSDSVVLGLCLANRLQSALALSGSTLYRLTWKAVVTPSGRRLSRLAASVPRTSENDSSGWPTPAARDHKSSASNLHGENSRPLNEVARLSAWNTPRATDGSHGGPNQGGEALPADAALAGWVSPAVSRGQYQVSNGRKCLKLEGQVQLTDSGPTPNGSTARTGSIGQLNPRHSMWLMGLPISWDLCGMRAAESHTRSSKERKQSGESIDSAAAETPSSPRSQSSSSKRLRENKG